MRFERGECYEKACRIFENLKMGVFQVAIY